VPMPKSGFLPLTTPAALTQSFSGWEPKKLWRHTADGAPFEECAFVEGFDSRFDGRSLISADLDGDGDQELLMLNRAAPKLQLFANTGEGGNAIELTFKPKSGNPEGEGTLVRTKRGIFPVVLQRGYASSVEPRVHLGLGADTTVDVEVQWRSGAREKFAALPAGNSMALAEGTGKASRVVPFAPKVKPPPPVFPSTLGALGLSSDGRPTLVQLFLRGCKPCAEEAPVLNALAKKSAMRVVGLGLHPEAELASAAKSLRIAYPVQVLPEVIADGLSTGGQLPLPIILVYRADGSLSRVLPGPKGLTSVLAEP